jgi:hypothetical protein
MYQSQIEQIESELMPIFYDDGTKDQDKDNNLDDDAWILVDKSKIPRKVILKDDFPDIGAWFI